MKDRIEDRLRVKVMPDLGKSLDVVDNTYKEFLHSKDKVKRTQLLRLLGKAASDAQNDAKDLIEMFGGSVFEGPLPGINSELAKRVRRSSGDNLLHAMNTLVMLAKNFVGIHTTIRALQPVQQTDQQKIDERVQLLFQMFITLADVTELTAITNPEPQKELIAS